MAFHVHCGLQHQRASNLYHHPSLLSPSLRPPVDHALIVLGLVYNQITEQVHTLVPTPPPGALHVLF